jgi:hypothetical protein
MAASQTKEQQQDWEEHPIPFELLLRRVNAARQFPFATGECGVPAVCAVQSGHLPQIQEIFRSLTTSTAAMVWHLSSSTGRVSGAVPRKRSKNHEKHGAPSLSRVDVFIVVLQDRC